MKRNMINFVIAFLPDIMWVMDKPRSAVMDIAKGLGIIAVVAGHSGGPIPLTNFLYLFHLPLFFFISGFFWKDSYLDNISLLVKRKVKELYLPFVKLQILFLLLNNFLFSIYIYSSNGLWTSPQYAQLPLTLETTIQRLTGILLFNGASDQLLGASWFLVVLFFMVFLFAIISSYFRKRPEYYRFAAVLMVCLSGFYLIQNKLYLERGLQTGMVALGLFYLGFLYKQYGQRIRIIFPLALLALTALLLAREKFNIILEMARNVYPAPIVFFVVTLSGIYLVLYLARVFERFSIPKRIFSGIGRNTLAILFLHFLAFKLVTLAFIFYSHYPIQMLARFPIIYNTNRLWVVYVVVGVTLPIITNIFYKFVKNKLIRLDIWRRLRALTTPKMTQV